MPRSVLNLTHILPFLCVHTTVCILRQVFPSAADGRTEDHFMDVPNPIRDASSTGSGRLQDPHHINAIDMSMADHYGALPLNVSSSYLSGIGPITNGQ